MSAMPYRRAARAVAAAWLMAIGLATGAARQVPAAAVIEQAYRSNNIGVARLERFEFEAAAAAFREALTLHPTLDLARLNLGIALFYGGQPDLARAEIAAARASVDTPHADYLLGLIDRAADRTPDAVAAFERVLAVDPDDVGTAINLAQLYRQAQRDAEAVALFRRAIAAEPYNATAIYGLATALLRTGAAEEGGELMARFERLTDTGAGVTYSQAYLAQGRYAEAIASTGAEAELVDTAVPNVSFVDTTAWLVRAAQPSGAGDETTAVTLADIDGDFDLDLIETGASGVRLHRNDDARLVDATALLPAEVASAPATGALVGDFDNDGRADIAILRSTGVRLLRHTADGFIDVTAASGLDALDGTALTAAWLDADHDGDLDLFVATELAGAAAASFWRNNGNGRFSDITAETTIAIDSVVHAVVPTDFDNRRDIDLFVLARGALPRLYRNLRDGTFRDVARTAGLTAGAGAVRAAAGDVDKDGRIDFFLSQPEGPGLFAASRGGSGFVLSEIPGAAGSRLAHLVDYDNDGLLDLVTIGAGGPRVLRNVGREWIDVTARAVPASMAAALASATSLAAGDIDGDGHVDLVAGGPAGVSIWRNEGQPDARALAVDLAPLVSNRSSVGARVELRAGSLRQLHEVSSTSPAATPAGIVFGLGARQGADAVRVLWPSGILQAELGEAGAPLPPGRLAIEELDRKPSSCPYLYTWNGERFEFVTDFLGGGEMGYWHAPGVRNTPDPDEYVRISGNQLRARDGRYELRITNELEEALFLDRTQLVVVAHPTGVDVHPNEGLGRPAAPFTMYTTEAPRPPLAAIDSAGRDVLDRVSRADRRFVDNLPLAAVRGYADDHALTLTLPPAGPGGRRLLLLTGWTDYAFSSDNVAAHQAGLTLVPPSLEVRAPDGTWRTAIDSIGVPVGRPQTVVVDLTDAIPANAREVRIRTTMRVYWDQVLVDTSDGRAPFTVDRLEADAARLALRGYSAELTPDGREPFAYDYARVSHRSPWKLLPGRYTREGDVRELVAQTDDMFVVARSGDEIALSFDARTLPALPDGWTRTFLLYAYGYSKEMNLHSSSPDALGPLPFRGMSAYPYNDTETYPASDAHRDYQARYNTRIVPRALPAIELDR